MTKQTGKREMDSSEPFGAQEKSLEEAQKNTSFEMFNPIGGKSQVRERGIEAKKKR